MRLPSDCEKYGLSPDRPYGNPFHQLDSLDMANMRGVERSGVGRVVDLLRGYAHLAATNLVDGKSELANRIRVALLDEVALLVQGENPRLRSGIVETTGSHSNERALRLAKRATGRKKIVCSTLTHGSVVEIARDLEMDVVCIPVNPDTMQMDELALLESVDGETAVLVLTAGVTNLGLIEGLPKSVEARLNELGVRLHVDAAYGGLNLGLQDDTQSGKQSFDALVNSDAVSSMTVDTHKFVGPMGCSTLLLRDEDVDQDDAYITGASWLTGTTQGAFIPFMALNTLQGIGRDRLQEHAMQNVRTGQLFARALERHGLSTVTPVESGVVPISLSSLEEAQFLYDALQYVGLNVPKPFSLQTTNGEVYGLRLVFTPDVYYDYLYLTEELAPMIADIVGKFRVGMAA